MPFLNRRTIPAATLLIAFASAQTCYYPDGETVSSDIPCDPSAAASSCCGPDSFCLADGLCYGGGLVTRGSCTDKSWSSGACTQYCQNEDPDKEIAITPCTSGGSSNTFVCGVNTTDCQTDSNTFSTSSDTGIILRPSQIAGLVDSALATGAPSSTAAQVTVTAVPGSGVYTGGQMAGLACGIALPLIAALVALFILLRREKRRFSKPKLMYRLPDEDNDDFSFQPPPPVAQVPGIGTNRSSHVSGVTSPTTSHRGSMRTVGTLTSSARAFSQRVPSAHSQTFLERYETMKRNAQAQSMEVKSSPDLHTPNKEMARYELSDKRMSG